MYFEGIICYIGKLCVIFILNVIDYVIDLFGVVCVYCFFCIYLIDIVFCFIIK